MPAANDDIRIRTALAPGDLGMIVHLHGVHYAREYGLDTTFEPYVAKPLADFVTSGQGRLWIAEQNASLVGSVALIDDGQGIGQLRWFLVVPSVRGQGLGRWMLGEAIRHGRACGMHRIFLWTFAELKEALRLYQHFGFVVTDEKAGQIWGAQRTELRMQLALVPTAGS
jgi:GNAT superfamily N-acetyltransferase